MHRDSLTPATPSPQNGFLPVCLCVAADNVHHVYLSLRVSPRNTISGTWLAFCQHCAHSHPHISVFVGTFVDQLLV